MSGTTILSMIDAVNALWVAGLPADVQVILGGVGTVTLTRDRVLIIGDADITFTESVFGSGQPTDENYDLLCTAAIIVPAATDQRAAIASAVALLNQATDLIRAQPEGLGVAGVISATVAGQAAMRNNLDERTLAAGRGVSIEFRIHVTAGI